jgi:hypothetical protein
VIPLTKKLLVEAIAGLSRGTVDEPLRDDVDLTVRFSNADDKHVFVKNWYKAKPDHMKLKKTAHGLTVKIEMLSYGFFRR